MIRPVCKDPKCLPLDLVKQMFQLFCKFYEGLSYPTFEAHLNEKDKVILVFDDEGLGGFTSFKSWNLGETNVVTSGDTIMSPKFWRSPILSAAWIQAVRQHHAGQAKSLFWLLLTSGYRTYKFLPTFWTRFYPHPDQPEEELETLAKGWAKNLFPGFQEQKGLVLFPEAYRLKAAFSPQPKVRDKFSVFFEERNPNHKNGDELLCCTQISEQNLTRAGKKMWYSEIHWEEIDAINS